MTETCGAEETMSKPLVSLYCIVQGPIYQRYWTQLLLDAQRYFLPGEAEIVQLPGIVRAPDKVAPPLWSHVSATRYEVALQHLDYLRGEYIFQIDADMRIVAPIGHEILCDGITTSLHPGVPPEQEPSRWPYERDPASRAYVAYGAEGPQYHPGCFIGGKRDRFLGLAETIAREVRLDLGNDHYPAWYEESHLNKYLIDHPAELVLGREYCWWAHWTPDGDYAAAGAKLVHLDKTGEEFEARG